MCRNRNYIFLHQINKNKKKTKQIVSTCTQMQNHVLQLVRACVAAEYSTAHAISNVLRLPLLTIEAALITMVLQGTLKRVAVQNISFYTLSTT